MNAPRPRGFLLPASASSYCPAPQPRQYAHLRYSKPMLGLLGSGPVLTQAQDGAHIGAECCDEGIALTP